MATDLVLFTATMIAAAIDIRVRRIPNLLTGALAIIAIALHVPQGFTATAISIASMLILFMLGTIVFRLGWFGGGDVKLLAACCGLVSYPNCIALVAFVLATGAALAILTAAIEGRLVALIRSTAAVVAHGAPTERSTLPYGVAIAGGSTLYIVSTLSSALRFP